MPNRMLTKEEFIRRALMNHGDKYDYSKVKYQGINNKVCIICPKHGEFWMTPNNHLKQGKGNCPCCTKEKRTDTLEDFINKAKQVHGDKYDYSKVEYKNCNTKVCIICPIHGEFWQIPYNHLMGKGCSNCAHNIKKTTATFVKEAKEVHGDKYDYSKVEYKDANTKICVICSIHGEFNILPNNHLRGCGCRKCHIEKRKIKPSEEHDNTFIKKAKQVHGDKYDYSKIEYKGYNEKLTVICPTHGKFEITPHNHLKGQGCRLCGIEKRTSKIKGTLEDFIEKARKVHGDKYDYSKVEYKNTNVKVCIICKNHGEFWQLPNSHLSNHGCPQCLSSNLEADFKKILDEKGIRYIAQHTFEWLKYKNNLHLDFYLPQYKIAIECQGIQHFKPIDYFGGQENLTERIKRDETKYHLCESNGIKIFYYTQENDIPQEFLIKHKYYTDTEELFKDLKTRNK